MTVRLARICSVDPFERIAIDWLFILFHSFFPLDSACIIGRLKRSKTESFEFIRNHRGSCLLLVRFLFRGLFYRTRHEADAFSVIRDAGTNKDQTDTAISGFCGLLLFSRMLSLSPPTVSSLDPRPSIRQPVHILTMLHWRFSQLLDSE